MREYTIAMKKMNEELKIVTKELEISKEFNKYFEATSNRSENLERMYRAWLTIKATSVHLERVFFQLQDFSTQKLEQVCLVKQSRYCFLKDHLERKVNHQANY